MNILVTGGAGFIGSNLVHHLLADGAEDDLPPTVTGLVVYDQLTYAGNRQNLAGAEADPRFRLVRGDVRDRAAVLDALDTHDIDTVVHLAAESHVDRSIDAPDDFVTTNVVGTFQVLEAFRRRLRGAVGRRFRFLQVSTDEVHGSLEDEAPPCPETAPLAPNSPYAATKAGSDHLVRAYHQTYGLPAITLSGSNNYGPFQFPEKLIPLAIRRVSQGKRVRIYGDGQQIRDWIYVEDFCRAIAALLHRGKPGETYNAGGNDERRNLDVIRKVITQVHSLQSGSSHRPPEDLVEFVEDRPGHDRRYALDCAKITGEVGWSPREPFEKGLRKTVQWYLDNEDWMESIEQRTYAGERLGSP